MSLDFDFPIKIGNKANVESYARKLTDGQEQLLVTRDGSLYLTDGNGGYVPVSSESSGSSESSNQAVVDWTPSTDYKKNTLISYDNKLYLAINDFRSGDVFYYNTANMFLVTTRSTGTGVQFWQPNTNYKVDDLIYFNNKIYKVNKGFQSGAQFTKDNLDLLITEHNSIEGIQGDGFDYFHLTAEKNQLVNELSDKDGKLVYKGVTAGNMHTSVYDRNNDGVVDKAETLLGLKVSVEELNQLQGTATNLQSQIEAISKGMTFKGEFPTYSDLENQGERVTGYTYIVDKDETQDGNRTYYIYQNEWYCLGKFNVETRNFIVDPLNLAKEVVGVLPEQNVSSLIARLTDLHEHVNFELLNTYTQSNASLTKAVEATHIHDNHFVLNKFSEDGSGNPLYNGKSIGGGTSTGIDDLSDFTTDDLVDYPNKRYVTDFEKEEIGKIPSISTGLNNVTSNVNSLLNKMPTNVNASNTLVTSEELKNTMSSISFKTLSDVGQVRTNELLTVDPSGNVISTPMVDSGISSIFDKNDEYNSITKLKFNKATAALENDVLVINPDKTYSTDIVDMPASSSFIDNGFLVADINTRTYVQKSIDDFTSKLENQAINITLADWGVDGCEVVHNLGSENIIVQAYENKVKVDMSYRIVDENTIKLLGTPKEVSIVINSSQGTINTAKARNSGGNITVTSSMFIDDNAPRTDKTYSSYKIEDMLTGYAKKANTYLKVECDAKYGLKTYEHSHNNNSVLENLRDIDGNLYYGNKLLVTSFNPTTYTKKFDKQTYKALGLLVDTSQIISEIGMKMINNAQILVKNNSVDEYVHLVVNEGNIAIVDVRINPGESQQYTLGISPDIKITVEGNFDASYTVTGF